MAILVRLSSLRRKKMARRTQVPYIYIQVARLLRPCRGYENGITIDAIAREVYGQDDPHSKQMARLHVGHVRRKIGVPVHSIKPPDGERRYCYLISETEYSRAINDFEKRITGAEKTKEELENERKAVKDRERLERVRRRAEGKKS